MVAVSQEEKCGLKYVIYIFRKKKAGPFLALPLISNFDLRLLDNANGVFSLDCNSIEG
jgi:hypothetical protein